MNNEEAIEYLKKYKYDNEVRQAIDTVLNYIEALKTTIKTKDVLIKKTNLEAQKYFDMLMEVEYGRDTIPKQKIKELKEKIHNDLDNNGITRAYQIKIDEYFEELLEEEK